MYRQQKITIIISHIYEHKNGTDLEDNYKGKTYTYYSHSIKDQE